MQFIQEYPAGYLKNAKIVGVENFSESADRQSFAGDAEHAPRNCKLDQWRL
jgi:hypothetical protein